jgi:hypothetical protein
MERVAGGMFAETLESPVNLEFVKEPNSVVVRKSVREVAVVRV